MGAWSGPIPLSAGDFHLLDLNWAVVANLLPAATSLQVSFD